ncbi:helix-turn-helix domain-containing protein [Azohydromonas aeria]|uniref:helix-turn-helix domain-containing protein n=1 Tax=Azohydromonas aeria TaxID=2590212 RepID=UPI002873F153|nr:helix-turn-helix domain-containing protein [Azohydromonas aeria]
MSTQRAVPRGQRLFQAGDALTALYAVRTGFFKTCTAAEDGRTQVTGFQMPGDLLGLAALETGRHTVDAVALEDSQVCVISCAPLAQASEAGHALQRQLLRGMSRIVNRDHAVMLLLGGMRARERLAAFLLDLAQRLQALGWSGAALVLRMTREDIGSYLGLTLETVSRAFSAFQAQGLLEVRQREIHLLDPQGLRRVVAGAGR